MSDYETVYRLLTNISQKLNTINCNVTEGGGGDNFFTADLVQTGTRVHDAAEADTTINNQGDFTINVTKEDAIFRVDNTFGFDNSYFEVQRQRINIVSNVGGTILSGVHLESAVVLGNSSGLYYIGDGFLYAAPPDDDTVDDFIVRNPINGQLFIRDVSSLPNFANTDLATDAARTHDLTNGGMSFTNAPLFSVESNSGSISHAVHTGTPGSNYSLLSLGTSSIYAQFQDFGGGVSSITMNAGIALFSASGTYSIAGLQTFADDTAAGGGGLVANQLYKTATGVVMIKL